MLGQYHGVLLKAALLPAMSKLCSRDKQGNQPCERAHAIENG
jgi:hypothetical protein